MKIKSLFTYIINEISNIENIKKELLINCFDYNLSENDTQKLYDKISNFYITKSLK